MKKLFYKFLCLIGIHKTKWRDVSWDCLDSEGNIKGTTSMRYKVCSVCKEEEYH